MLFRSFLSTPHHSLPLAPPSLVHRQEGEHAVAALAALVDHGQVLPEKKVGVDHGHAVLLLPLSL